MSLLCSKSFGTLSSRSEDNPQAILTFSTPLTPFIQLAFPLLISDLTSLCPIESPGRLLPQGLQTQLLFLPEFFFLQKTACLTSHLILMLGGNFLIDTRRCAYWHQQTHKLTCTWPTPRFMQALVHACMHTHAPLGPTASTPSLGASCH